jgi:hypothetical protein
MIIIIIIVSVGDAGRCALLDFGVGREVDEPEATETVLGLVDTADDMGGGKGVRPPDGFESKKKEKRREVPCKYRFRCHRTPLPSEGPAQCLVRGTNLTHGGGGVRPNKGQTRKLFQVWSWGRKAYRPSRRQPSPGPPCCRSCGSAPQAHHPRAESGLYTAEIIIIIIII